MPVHRQAGDIVISRVIGLFTFCSTLQHIKSVFNVVVIIRGTFHMKMEDLERHMNYLQLGSVLQTPGPVTSMIRNSGGRCDFLKY